MQEVVCVLGLGHFCSESELDAHSLLECFLAEADNSLLWNLIAHFAVNPPVLVSEEDAPDWVESVSRSRSDPEVGPPQTLPAFLHVLGIGTLPLLHFLLHHPDTRLKLLSSSNGLSVHLVPKLKEIKASIVASPDLTASYGELCIRIDEVLHLLECYHCGAFNAKSICGGCRVMARLVRRHLGPNISQYAKAAPKRWLMLSRRALTFTNSH
jgi:hypothetical protein